MKNNSELLVPVLTASLIHEIHIAKALLSSRGINSYIFDENIFESFFTTKEMGEGLGLGLPIIQGIVRDYNGSISVESTPGSHTSFRILFPAQP